MSIWVKQMRRGHRQERHNPYYPVYVNSMLRLKLFVPQKGTSVAVAKCGFVLSRMAFFILTSLSAQLLQFTLPTHPGF